VNPVKEWSSREIERCASLGLKVLKLHFMASGLDLRKKEDYARARAAVEAASRAKLTIIVHANYPRSKRGDEIEKLKELIEEFPEVRWIIGHLFGAEFRGLEDLKHPRFLVEISVAPLWMNTPEKRAALVNTIRKVGIRHFVFGSDWPVIHPAETLKALRALPLSEEELAAILYRNAEQLDDLF
jgi:predicted TIM-barrel fold metal-dependent hydrolase